MKANKIKEGVYLLINKTNKFKTNCLSFVFADDSEEFSKMEYTFLSYLLSRRSYKYSRQDLLFKKDELFGLSLSFSSYKKCNVNFFNFSVEYINAPFANNIEKEVLSVFRELLFYPYIENYLFNKSYFQETKNDLINEYYTRIDKKKYKASQGFSRCIDKKHPFNSEAYKTLEDIESISNERVSKLYFNILNKTLFVVGSGNINKKTIKKFISNNFCERKDYCLIRNIPYPNKEESSFVENDGRYNQSVIYNLLTFKSRGENKYVSNILNLILGGYSSSRLFSIVREKFGLCYSINSYVKPEYNLIVISTACAPEKSKYTINVIKEIINEIIKNSITQEEVENAKKIIQNSLNYVYESNADWVGFATNRVIEYEEVNIKKVAKKYTQISFSDVDMIAKTLRFQNTYCLQGGSKDE